MTMEHTQSMRQAIHRDSPANRTDQAADDGAMQDADSPQSGLAILRNVFLYLLLLPGAILMLLRIFLY